jgi:ABC-type branched-subunit amino acid transport system substrate-binding protein
LLLEDITMQGSTLDGRKIRPQLAAKRIAQMNDTSAPAIGKWLAGELAKTARASGAKVVAGEAANDQAADFPAFLTRMKCVQPDLNGSGCMNATGGPLTKQAARLGIRAKILGGDGVWTDKVGELAKSAVQNPVCLEAAFALSDMTKGAGFEKKHEGRSDTPVQSDAPLTYEALSVSVEAIKRAHSIDAPEVLAAMPSPDYDRVTGSIAFDDKGDLKEGAITLYDFKDSEAAVLEAVEM